LDSDIAVLRPPQVRGDLVLATWSNCNLTGSLAERIVNPS
jgi:hypothetical protein